MNRSLFPLLCGVALVGCDRLGPDYQAPSIELSNQFVNAAPSSLQNAASSKWWEKLNDPLLNELVAKGSSQNLDVQTALERMTSAEAALGTVGLNAQTAGGWTASATRQDFGAGVTTNRNSAIDGRYVLDLFGGFARGQEQALANFDAAQVNVGVVRLAYLADITSAYVQARYFQEAAAITRSTIRSRKQTLDLVSQRRSAGEATELEVQQARSDLASSEAGLPILVANFETNVFRVATLLAEPAQPILARMQAGSAQPRPSGFTTIGHPADLLRNRPDIQVAERNLAAATAAVGVAEAQLYPSITLNGTLGTGTTDSWSFGPSLNVPVLNRGVLRANQEIAESTAREAELNWRSTVLAAVEDVQSALTLCLNWRRQLTSLERASAASASVLDLSRESYRGGAITLTDVLDAERQHANNRLSMADALRNYTLSWMDVQVTTGRGWLTGQSATHAATMRPQVRPDPLGISGG